MHHWLELAFVRSCTCTGIRYCINRIPSRKGSGVHVELGCLELVVIWDSVVNGGTYPGYSLVRIKSSTTPDRKSVV